MANQLIVRTMVRLPLNSDIGDYEETYQNGTQNMDSIRSILIARQNHSYIRLDFYLKW